MSGPRVLVPGRAGAAVRSHHGLEGILCRRLWRASCAVGSVAVAQHLVEPLPQVHGMRLRIPAQDPSPMPWP